MASLKQAELRDLPDDGLMQRLAEAKEDLFKLRFRHITGELPNYAALSELRRDVARIHTELRAREIAAAEALENEDG
jgi:large subunit ribosomal protein L29